MTTYPNWFAPYVWNFERFLRPLAGESGIRALQIGAYTGDASVWLLDNILTGTEAYLVDVDTWEGSDEPAHRALDWDDVWKVYGNRVMGLPVAPYRMTSDEFFSQYPEWKFDFIYIDGDHHADQVARDGANADKALVVGGILAFDDYLWSMGDGHEPRVAIDEFIATNGHRYDTLVVNAQVWLCKTADG